MKTIYEEKEERIKVLETVPDNYFGFRTLYVYVEGSMWEHGEGGDLFRIDMGTDRHNPMGGLTVGDLERMILLRDAITRVIDKYQEVQGGQRD